MKKLPTASDSDDSGDQPTHKNPSMYLILSMMDTTWRMFVPTIGLLLVGGALDEQYHTKPWLMLVGVTLGGLVAWYLIKKQLRSGS